MNSLHGNTTGVLDFLHIDVLDFLHTDIIKLHSLQFVFLWRT